MNTTGVGLGLSICMKIVEVFEGTIVLDEDVDEQTGSSFTFTIKCVREEGILAIDAVQQEILITEEEQDTARSN